MIKTLALAALAFAIVGGPTLAFADDACMTQATSRDKPLTGAAKTSFLKKCETTACEAKAQAMDKPLHGAAKNSFVAKCVKDAMAMPM
jgi:hypothetical protein